MQITVQQGDLTQVSCDVLIVNLFEGVTKPGGGTGAVDHALGGWISELIAQEQFKGTLNTTLDFPTFGKIPAKRVVVVGLGKADAFTLEQVRQAAAKGIQQAKGLKAQTVATILHGAGIAGLPVAECAQAVTEGTLLGGHAFTKYKTQADEPTAEIAKVIIVEQDAGKLEAINAGINTGVIIAEATNMARELATEPPDLVTPNFLAQTAREIGSEFGLAVEVWEEQRLIAERMQCLLMVGRGSCHFPRFIQLHYTPQAGEPRKRICLVGKGLCYDSGGLSLKPASAMQHMKTDMSGAAAVLAIMKAIAILKPQVAVTGMIPACENMTGPAAYKVDDILRARNGKTIEIDNTDAEGRLVLADALSLAAEQGFDEVIDFATLTGGCIIALARVWTGVMGTDQGLIDRIIETGKLVGEKMWMLPFDQEVRDMLDSDVADMKNAGGREGSAISGGMFLQEFAGDQPWAHLDIAGTSFLDKGRGYEPKGATGVPVRTMIAYIMGM